jgi:iron complex transport system permease protein
MISRRNIYLFSLLVVLLPLMAGWHLVAGQIHIGLSDHLNAWFNFDTTNTQHILVREFRFPRMIMAILSGSGLAISGMLMQTLFRNPLAGPYILGINSGASLAVATGLLTGFSFLQNEFGLVALALIGALFFGFIILGFSIFVRNSLSLLLIGIMLGSFTSAITQLIQSMSTAESIKNFMLWGMGSLQQVELDQIPLIFILFVGGILLTAYLVRPLNALILGEDAATSLGINVQKNRILVIIATAILAGLITAFCGPIAFVGLAIPNLSRILFKTQDHLTLLFGNILLGALFMICSDIVIQSMESSIVIPINVITSIIGAPFVIYIILKRLA